MLDKAPDKRVADFLDVFGKALSAGDIEKAASQFQDDCYWRDLVAFTWNIRTMEGKDQVRDMLKSQLALTEPSNWAIAERRGSGRGQRRRRGMDHLRDQCCPRLWPCRLKDGRVWTLLTTMSELKGHEEPVGAARPLGVPGRAEIGKKSWKEEREQEIAELGHSRQPYCLIIGGGQGGIGLAARLKQLNVPTIIVEKNERPGDSWRKRYKSLCLHDPVWYDHMPYLPFPRELAGILAEGQDRRLARDVHQGHGAQLLGLDRMQERVVRRQAQGMDRCRSARRQGRRPEAQAAGFRHRHGEQACHPRPSRPRRLRGRPASFVQASRTGRLCRQARRGDRLQYVRARHLRRFVGGRRRCDDGAAFVNERDPVRAAHRDRHRRTVFRKGRGRRDHDRESRPDLGIHAIRPDGGLP